MIKVLTLFFGLGTYKSNMADNYLIKGLFKGVEIYKIKVALWIKFASYPYRCHIREKTSYMHAMAGGGKRQSDSVQVAPPKQDKEDYENMCHIDENKTQLTCTSLVDQAKIKIAVIIHPKIPLFFQRCTVNFMFGKLEESDIVD